MIANYFGFTKKKIFIDQTIWITNLQANYSLKCLLLELQSEYIPNPGEAICLLCRSLHQEMCQL